MDLTATGMFQARVRQVRLGHCLGMRPATLSQMYPHTSHSQQSILIRPMSALYSQVSAVYTDYECSSLTTLARFGDGLSQGYRELAGVHLLYLVTKAFRRQLRRPPLVSADPDFRGILVALIALIRNI